MAIVPESKADVEHKLAQLSKQLSKAQQELISLRRANRFKVTLPELHDPDTGRIDAEKLAGYLGISLKRLAEGLGLTYKTVHRNPTSDSFQPILQPVKRAVEILHDFFEKPATVRIWVNTPHPDLNGQTALELILSGQTRVVLTILENAAAGVPV